MNKRNKGEAGARGIILDPDEQKKLKYAWGLGNEANNEVEAITAYQGISLLWKKTQYSITIIRYFAIVIWALVKREPPH